MNLHELSRQFHTGEITKKDYIEAMGAIHAHLFHYRELLNTTDIESISITKDSVRFQSRELGIICECDRYDSREAPLEILNFGCYEKRNVEMVCACVEKDSVFLDIGANIGWYSLAVARVCPSATIHSFEPVESTYATLCKNITANGATMIQPHNFGCAEKEDTLTFYVHPHESGKTSMADIDDSDRASVRVSCAVKPLDTFVAHENLHSVDCIKCDVEGAELFVYRGAEKTLRRFQPAIFSEMLRKWSASFGYHPNDIIAFLGGLQYQCFAATATGIRPCESVTADTTETNFFFLHPHKHSSFIERFCE